MDSAYINDDKARFTGEVDMPCFALVTVDGSCIANFYVENDTIDVLSEETEISGGVRTDWSISGGELNRRRRLFQDQYMELAARLKTKSDAEWAQFSKDYSALIIKTLEENADNAFGADLAITAKKDRSYFEAHPAIMQLETVKAYLHGLEIKEKLRPGNPFSDFSVRYEGQTRRLSDVVGKGDYVLLDFWASWCGPCMQAMAHLKKLDEKYGDRNFKILGVTVNDKPENSLHRIKEFELPWEIWISDNSKEAVAAYIVESIPHTVLFAPDGTILLNNPPMEELEQRLTEIFNKTN